MDNHTIKRFHYHAEIKLKELERVFLKDLSNLFRLPFKVYDSHKVTKAQNLFLHGYITMCWSTPRPSLVRTSDIASLFDEPVSLVWTSSGPELLQAISSSKLNHWFGLPPDQPRSKGAATKLKVLET